MGRQRCLGLFPRPKSQLEHILSLRTYHLGDFMHLDQYTRRNLELVATLRDHKTQGSLLWVLDRTVTAGENAQNGWSNHYAAGRRLKTVWRRWSGSSFSMEFGRRPGVYSGGLATFNVFLAKLACQR